MSNINVVIADDNERIRQNLQEIVSRECDMTLVGSASDGMDALSMIRTSHPDVVLLDIIMPKMDGLGVLEEVKKDENLLKKPAFIILTAMGQEEVMEEAVRKADRLMYQAKCRKNAVMVEVPGHNLAALEKLLQNKPQILLVDDSAMNRMMLTEILGDSYHILEAENGRECMEKLQAEAGNIALVLLDINMPVMDGVEVLKAMNANHTIEDIPVIMISSEDSDATIRRSYELGASDYVNRPFDARIVYRRVTNTIKLYAKQRRLVQMVSDLIRSREKITDVLVGFLSLIV